MEGDVSAGAGPEGGEGDVGGLGEGYRVPGVSCERQWSGDLKNSPPAVSQNTHPYTYWYNLEYVNLLSPWQRRGPTVKCASEPTLLVSPTTTFLTGR